jgi:hypothetical protein
MKPEQVDELKKCIQIRDEAIAKVKEAEDNLQKLCLVITREKLQQDKDSK